eukprot:UN23108
MLGSRCSSDCASVVCPVVYCADGSVPPIGAGECCPQLYRCPDKTCTEDQFLVDESKCRYTYDVCEGAIWEYEWELTYGESACCKKFGGHTCPDVDCVGEWSECTLACETSKLRTFNETVSPSGNGTVCPTSTDDCQPGDGQCVAPVDCEGVWSSCTASCESAKQRSFTEIVARQGLGRGCPPPEDCQDGEDLCTYVDCVGDWSHCTNECQIWLKIESFEQL